MDNIENAKADNLFFKKLKKNSFSDKLKSRFESKFIRSILETKLFAYFVIFLNLAVYFANYNIRNYFGFLFIFSGLAIYFIGRIQMGDAYSFDVQVKNHLIDSGLFRHIRHPLYLGVIIACLGTALLTYSFWLLALCIFFNIPFFYYRAKLEESLLAESMEGYKTYMKRTWMFIPKII